MNNFFDYSRFSLLVKRQWTENKFIFLMGIAIFVSITSVLYSINFDSENNYMLNKGIQIMMFVIGLFAGGTLFANYLFKDFGNNIQTMSFLMTPASHFEKISAGMFYAFIVFPIAFFITFGLVDGAFVKLSGNPHNEMLYAMILNSYKEYDFFVNVWIALQMFVILGAIYFGRMSYIKTAFTGFLLLASLVLIQYLLFTIIIGKGSHNIDMGDDNRHNLSSEFRFMIDGSKYAFYYVLAPVIAVIAYFKLKEKEV